jgi:hypothetical protein
MVSAWSVSLLLQSSYRSVQVQRLLIVVVLLGGQHRIPRAVSSIEVAITGLCILAGWGVTSSLMMSVNLLALQRYPGLWL